MALYDIIDWHETGVETEVWDVRSPAEFALDRVTGAKNVPVLSDHEREEVGRLYKSNPFRARKLGAAIIATNVARLLREDLVDRDGTLHPLIYCWRGGLRSQSIATILAHVGWRVNVLAGGYKAYRDHVREALEKLPGDLSFRVIAGPTGSAKTAMIHELARQGEQTLDLEGLAAHRGSLLGEIPGLEQPTQKRFESAIYNQLRHFEPTRPVWLEAESHRIGAVHIPDEIFRKMRLSPTIEIQTSLHERVRYLVGSYQEWCDSPDLLGERLQFLTRLRGSAKIEHWQRLVREESWEELTSELLRFHYDPTYSHAMNRFQGRRQLIGVQSLGDVTGICRMIRMQTNEAFNDN